MTKEEIYNTYAIKQGYECWDNLVNEKINEQRLSLYYDFNAITDLIQEELKKKIYKDVSESVLGNIFKCNMLEDKILNIEIL